MEAILQGGPDNLCTDYLDAHLCPCILAEIKRCPLCSHLQGKELCDCQWSGTCILQNYRFNEVTPTVLPKGNACHVIRAFQVGSDGILLYFHVAQETLNSFHDFTILRLTYSNLPARVRVHAMVTEVFPEKNLIEVAVFAPDLQDQHILQNQSVLSAEILPNQGIFGLAPMYYINNSSILLLASNYGSLIIPSLIRMLQKSGNQVTVASHQLHPYLKARIRALLPLLQEYSSIERAIQAESKKPYEYICSLTSTQATRFLTNNLEKNKLNVPLAMLNTELFPLG